MKKNWEIAQKIALRFILIYIVVSGLWVSFSDLLSKKIFRDGYHWVNTAKGWVFVIFSGWLFYTLIKKGINDDITNRRYAEMKLKESEERYRKLVEYSPETILIYVDEKIVFINQSGINLLGAENINEIIGKSVLNITNYKSMSEYQKNEKNGIAEHQIKRLDGKHIYGEILTFQTTYKGEEAIQMIIRDITDKKMTQEQVRIMAYFDPLTKLANRNQLYQYIEEEIPRLQKDNDTLAIMFLDLDRFKIINDTFGHGFGDLLLKEASKRLNQCMNEQNKLFRYGGDEYIVITKYKEIEDVEEIAQCIIDKLEKPFTINARQTYVTTSIGISLYPKDGETVEELIQTADSAMYRAKENGKNNYQFYKSSFNSNNQRKIDLENGMRKALEQNDFILFYQPQVELLSGNIIGLEALIRWEHPEYGFISPGEFIPIAEETGLIIPIGKWVLKEACKQNKIWQKKGINCMQIAVNVSPLQFKDKNFIKTVKEIMNETEMNASCLELEITESTTRDVEEAMKVMEELKELGVNLAIDDFGTGYSSLNYLRYFPIKKLKIDKSFVDEIGKNFKGEAVIKTIIKLGNDLGFNVMAEGIEKDEQVLFLQQNNCQCGQGYFFYKPLSVDEVEKVLK